MNAYIVKADINRTSGWNGLITINYEWWVKVKLLNMTGGKNERSWDLTELQRNVRRERLRTADGADCKVNIRTTAAQSEFHKTNKHFNWLVRCKGGTLKSSHLWFYCNEHAHYVCTLLSWQSSFLVLVLMQVRVAGELNLIKKKKSLNIKWLWIIYLLCKPVRWLLPVWRAPG